MPGIRILPAFTTYRPEESDIQIIRSAVRYLLDELADLTYELCPGLNTGGS